MQNFVQDELKGSRDEFHLEKLLATFKDVALAGSAYVSIAFRRWRRSLRVAFFWPQVCG